jgi:membrane protease YdiL (CAAX protease family)
MNYIIPIYILATVVVTIIFAIFQQKIGLHFEKISLPQLAPGIVGIILLLLHKSIPDKFQFYFSTNDVTKMICAVLLPFGIFSIVYIFGKYFGFTLQSPVHGLSILPITITGMVIGVIGEEIGWRGFLQPLMEIEYSVLFSSVFVGLIWGLWHVGHYKNGFVFMIGFLLFTVSSSILISYLLIETKHNILLASIFHLTINICFLLFFSSSATQKYYMLLNGLIWLIVTLPFAFKMHALTLKNTS